MTTKKEKKEVFIKGLTDIVLFVLFMIATIIIVCSVDELIS